MKNITWCIFISLFCILFTYNSAYSKEDKNILESCFSNIHKITNAVKKYNKENKEQIININNTPLNFKNNYLKEIKIPAAGCSYHSVGNLSDKGIIYCSIHGDVEHFVYCDAFAYENMPKLSQVCSDDQFSFRLEEIKKIRKIDENIRLKDSERLMQKKKKLYVFAIMGIIISFTELLRIIYKYIRKNKEIETNQ